MRKAIALLAAIGGGVLIAWIGGSRAVTGAPLAVDWPSRDFASQFPDREENDSATRLLSIVERFGDDFGKIRRGIAPRGFLEKNANTIRTLRAQIVSNPPPVWPLQIDDILEPPSPPNGIHMQLFQLLAADAIAQHNGGNERAAWTDLRAAWILSRSLWDRPDVMSIATAMIGTRVVTAAAARLDPPAPAWWAEVASFDIRTPLLRSIEYEAWATRMRAERYPAGESDGSGFEDVIRRAVAPIARPIRVAQASFAIARFHETAALAAKSDPCEPLVIASMPEWAGFVRRFHRFEIEREGVDKFLTRRFSSGSRCKSGRWTYDGTTLAFHGALPPPTSRVTIIPLRYQVTR